MSLAITLAITGISIVAIMLAMLIFIIKLASTVIGVVTGNKHRSTKDEAFAAAAAVLEIEEEREESELQNTPSDEELIAVLTAAVMASMNNETQCNIRVKSFRRIPQVSPVWNVRGRADQLSAGL